MKKDVFVKIQQAMNAAGAMPPFQETGEYGPRTEDEVDRYDFTVTAQRKLEDPVIVSEGNPAYEEAKKYAGKKETDSKFNKWLSGFWKSVGLPGYKTIIGTSFAWCGLFIAAMNSEAGLDWIKNGAGAKNWAKYGQAIEWKTNGIPRGAVLHIDHDKDCKGGGNHVTFADGDCTVADLTKPNATFPGFGGNQGNTVKRSIYAVKEICAVRWPKELPLPKPVTKSVDCAGASSGGESTR